MADFKHTLIFMGAQFHSSKRTGSNIVNIQWTLEILVYFREWTTFLRLLCPKFKYFFQEMADMFRVGFEFITNITFAYTMYVLGGGGVSSSSRC